MSDVIFTDMKVEYVDHMGSDINVVNAARVSFAKEVTEFDLEKDTKLINYLAKHNHWSPLAHTAVTLRIKAPIFMARQFVKHQVGMCLSGDTEITFVKKVNGISNGVSKRKLSYLADMWFGNIKYQGGKKGKLNVSNAHVRVFNEDTSRFEESHIVNVIDSGLKDVFVVTDNYGNTIKATLDHKFLTDTGWKGVGELSLNDKLVRHDMGETFSKKLLRSNDSGDVICRREFRKSINELNECAECGGVFEKEQMSVDHIVPVSSGGSHDVSNLQSLCEGCHKIKSSEERANLSNTTLLPKYVGIYSISHVGKEQCYDLSVDNIHNFIGNGFVVHNCWNEESRRYIDDTPEFYKPRAWRGRPVNAKQGSGDGVVEGGFWRSADNFYSIDERHMEHIESSLMLYEDMLKAGVAPEQARMELPQCTMTNWVWTGSLVAFARVVKLRVDSHAQVEAQELGSLIEMVVALLYPVSWKALMDHMKV
jgi:thymidylate synthase ThyX